MKKRHNSNRPVRKDIRRNGKCTAQAERIKRDAVPIHPFAGFCQMCKTPQNEVRIRRVKGQPLRVCNSCNEPYKASLQKSWCEDCKVYHFAAPSKPVADDAYFDMEHEIQLTLSPWAIRVARKLKGLSVSDINDWPIDILKGCPANRLPYTLPESAFKQELSTVPGRNEFFDFSRTSPTDPKRRAEIEQRREEKNRKFLDNYGNNSFGKRRIKFPEKGTNGE